MPIDYLAAVRSESGRFAAVLADADPGAPVPSCPDWTAADLLWHLGEVQSFWGTVVRDRLTTVDGMDEPARPDSQAGLAEFFAASHVELVEALAGADDSEPVWSWLPTQHSVGFVRRRQAHEALIHRLDAELTAGAVTGFDADLATDGALEALEWNYAYVPEWATSAFDGATGVVATTDTGARWLVRLGAWSGHSPSSGKDYTDEPGLAVVGDGEPVFAVSGTARDVDAWLWGRPALAPVTVQGDAGAFLAMVRRGLQ